MKKTLLAAIIAATALVPPAALAQDWRGRGGNRERVQNETRGGDAGASDWRGNRGGGERAQPQAQAAAPAQDWRGNRGGDNGGGWRQRQQPAQAQPAAQPVQQQQQDWRGNRGGNRGGGQWNGGQQTQQAPQQQQQDWRGNRGGNRGGQWNGGQQTQQAPQQRQQDWRGNRGGNRGGGQWNGGQGQQQQDWRGNRGNNGGWNSNRGNRGSWNSGWRSNNRYDWRGYRNTNRSIFRLPRYYAPSGWGYGYRRFSIGLTLNSILFSSQYWINDPWYYRLPEVDGPYRWVRYYNDALLVDIYTGEVVDTVYDIFW